ncbi:DUF167 domain-containing protein [Aquabacter spiritensis]|uniref:UPF0235 protein EDC64_101501 n=1 Tax=Aquabacter spiritensis TaxID=933073 RepID=A0A4R3M4M2_9HYPH|nr:DUF167 family protein [Aquabacter spiritensis]TCT07982.1 hypothetical protein EDC64_101501 [Aquabacter spiritensis]
MPFWQADAGGFSVRVRVTPKGGRDAIDGPARLADGSDVLKVRVRVAPEDGAANAAVGRVLAEAFDLAPSRVVLAAGATSRIKTFRLDGDLGTLATIAAALASSKD